MHGRSPHIAATATGLAAGAGLAARWITDLLVPPRCPLCDVRISRGPGLCGDCHPQLTLISDPVHPITGEPLPFRVNGDAFDVLADKAPPVWRRARAAVAFSGAGRDLVHALKYRDRHDCVPLMARLMARAGNGFWADNAVVVPVPLHWRRQVSRQFNQSALLARQVAREMDLPLVLDAVVRSRATRPQVGLDEAGRHGNVARAFKVPGKGRDEITGRPVILIDDVLTTGATAQAVARTMMEAGAFAVDVLTFARVTDKDGLFP